jgi:hypothetical protein
MARNMKYKTAIDVAPGDIVILGQVHQTVESCETVQDWTVLRYMSGLKSIFPNRSKLAISGHVELVPKETIVEQFEVRAISEIDEAIDALKHLKYALRKAGVIP